MKWKVGFSSQSLKFLDKNSNMKGDVFILINNAVRKIQGENINVNIKKLKGEWSGFYRVKKGNLRVIIEFDFDSFFIFIEIIDWRGGAYKH